MRLTYLSRTDYRRKSEPAVVQALRREFGPCYVLPEGGSNELAAQGCAFHDASFGCCVTGSNVVVTRPDRKNGISRLTRWVSAVNP